MTASDATRLQVNFKTKGGTLINLYAVGLADLNNLLDEVSNVAGKVSQVEALFDGTRNVATQLGGQQVATEQFAPPTQGPPLDFAQPQQGGNYYGQQQQQYQPPAQQHPGGPVCPHGQMEYKEGKGRTGPWKAYFCPLPKDNPQACKPQWL